MAQESSGPAGEADSGSENMIAHLEEILRELEGAQGCEDQEARAALAQLKDSTAALAEAEAASKQNHEDAPRVAVPDVLELASSLDRLDAQLGALEASLDSADEPSKHLLQQTAQLWLTPAAVPEESGLRDYRHGGENGATASASAGGAGNGMHTPGVQTAWLSSSNEAPAAESYGLRNGSRDEEVPADDAGQAEHQSMRAAAAD